ncbi:hypothetical protein K227x_21980 [Rubripirellula lacrimiformis]|uniref:Rho termination factor-like N-terminal domain-containing protein n=1 Tax=Rubripirellula lacrimiformis TaxID=1930273 RepID=A0A517N9K4_9BACT|nr:DUF4912 domain-containing protein [Rubripirellula lacrimiformis]QDT03813.1 hypothetical protein K227x_21980 [Rubripirellula lacrimiformis]
MITTADLKAQTRRELADLARDYGVPGWHGMKKDELVDEIKKVQRKLRRKSSSQAAPAVKGASAKKASAPAAVKTGASATGSSKRRTAKTEVTASDRDSVRASSSKSSASLGGSATKSSRGSASSAKAGSGKASSSKVSAPTSAARVAARPPKSGSHKTDQMRLNKPVPKLPEPRVDAKTARIRAQMRKRRETMMKNKDLSTGTLVGGSAVNNGAQRTRGAGPHSDRVVLLVRDSFWLQATWEITRASVQRAQSSLAERWHTAMPVLRLLAVGDVDSNGAERTERDIPIHGGVNNWYIDVDEPPSRFRVLVGYVTSSGDFYTLCRSNVVETPRPNECERLDEHWHDIAEDYERIYSLSGGYDTDAGDLKEVFEERLRRPMPLRGDKGQTVGDPSLLRQSKLPFEVDAELIIFGKTLSSASVLVAGRPVKLQADGSFTVRMQLPDKRQVLPVTAESRDGLRQRTTVVAVERNTKVMEPVELEDRF